MDYPVPDGGWGRIVVAASFILQGITGGFCVCYGIFFPEFMEAYKSTESSIAGVGSVFFFSNLATGMFHNFFIALQLANVFS